MSYRFENQAVGKVTITDEEENKITLSGINARENDANILMGGLSYLFDVVGWTVEDVFRTVNQDVVEVE